MKIIKIVSIVLAGLFSIQFASAQSNIKTESITVNGNCQTCKKKIEKSALAAGATIANWDKKTKLLNISFNPATSTSSNIQQAIAGAGYDTQDYKATDSAYHELDDCCQYDRVALKAPAKKK